VRKNGDSRFEGGRGMSLQGKLWFESLKQIPAMHYYDPKLKPRSRELRNRSTLAEVLLWNQLKHRKMLGYSFLRQRPIHKYIVDFYCPRLKLVIEIDGESHGNKFHRDQTRERDLKNLGLWVLRFHDRNVKHDMRNVLRCIQNWIEQHDKENTQGHPPTPPSKGGISRH
jgi:very-short-patch-repair endonuclease